MALSVSPPYIVPTAKILWQSGELCIAVERIGTVRYDCGDITRQHWDEIAGYKDEIRLDPDWEEYLALERKGALRIIVLRECGEIIGYALYVLTGHLHYRSIYQAINDLLYLRPDKRKSSLGARLLKVSEDYLRDHGVTKIVQHVKPHMNFGPLLERMGYRHEELIFGKLLQEDR